MPRLYVGSRYRENAAIARATVARNKEAGDEAMAAALEACAALGRGTGERVRAKREGTDRERPASEPANADVSNGDDE